MRTHQIKFDPGAVQLRLMRCTLEERGAYMTLLCDSYRGFGRYEDGRVTLPNANDDRHMRQLLGRQRKRLLPRLSDAGLIQIAADGTIWCADYDHGAWIRRGASPDELARVIERHGAVCAYCGATENLSVDHIVAIANGGPERVDNYQPLCRPCNSRKGARPDG